MSTLEPGDRLTAPDARAIAAPPILLVDESRPPGGDVSAAFDPLGAPLWNAPDAVRFIDSLGVAWRVVACASGHVPGARGARCLVFLSEGVVRRVWTFPPDWRTLAPAALEALMARPYP